MARVGLALYGITNSVIASDQRERGNLDRINFPTRLPARIATRSVAVGLRRYSPRNDEHLKPILQLKTKLIQIKPLQKGDRVGYDGTFSAKKETTLGVLPIGYYDGVDRRLSNRGFIKLNDNFCPIVGRVSMNITTIDISKAKDAKLGDEVTIYSSNPKDLNSISTSASICKTISYDLLVNLASSTKRIIV